jgi:hypothetical protein
MPQGAVGMMTIVNDGQPCGMTVYGVALERRNPADSGTIKQAPRHGKAEFIGPRVQYTPGPGFAGDDEFSFEASARGASGASMLLKVRMKVTVLAPR